MDFPRLERQQFPWVFVAKSSLFPEEVPTAPSLHLIKFERRFDFWDKDKSGTLEQVHFRPKVNCPLLPEREKVNFLSKFSLGQHEIVHALITTFRLLS